MSTILEIAQDVADDLSISRPLRLFGLDDEGDTSPRRLVRAITRTCEFLRDSYAWQQSKREHRFLTIAGSQQTRALPADFHQFVPDTMFDRSRRLPMKMAEGDADWAFINGFPVTSFPVRWVRRGNDIWLSVYSQAGIEISYEYVSKAIGEDLYKPHPVTYSTDGMTLPINGRVVVRTTGHALIIPELGPGDHIELAPEGGTWENIGCTFTTVNGAPFVNRCPPGYRDWLTISRDDAQYSFEPRAGHWLNLAIPTTNGMMLEAGRRYLVGQGHLIYVPVLTSGEWIELVPSTNSWNNHGARFLTRAGQTISPPLINATLATLTADMAIVPAYTLTSGQTAREPWGLTRPITRFSADDQAPLWDDGLVRLGVIWQMQARDGQSYGQDFQNFERAIYDHVKGSSGLGRVSMDPGMDRGRRPRQHSIVVVDEQTWTEFQ